MLHLRIARRTDERAAWDTLPGFAQVLTSLTVFSVAGTSSMIKFIAVVYGDQFASQVTSAHSGIMCARTMYLLGAGPT